LRSSERASFLPWVTCFAVQYFVSAEIPATGRAAEHL
jgi:hypothetical protein